MRNGKREVDCVTDMKIHRDGHWGRREFVKGVAALTGSAALLGYDLVPAAAEPPPETTRFRIAQGPFICYAHSVHPTYFEATIWLDHCHPIMMIQQYQFIPKLGLS